MDLCDAVREKPRKSEQEGENQRGVAKRGRNGCTVLLAYGGLACLPGTDPARLEAEFGLRCEEAIKFTPSRVTGATASG